jgi:hypothetical protein
MLLRLNGRRTMEAPVGFVGLRDAADMVGRKVSGASWRPIAEVDPNDIACKLNAVIEQVITLIAERCERGEIAAAYRSVAGGADSLDRTAWQAPHWRNYFATGTIDLDLPLIDEKGRPNPNGYTARCAREIFLRRDDLEGSLDRQFGKPAPAPRKSPGRKPGSAPKMKLAQEAIEALWPNGPPPIAKLPSRFLCDRVMKWLREHRHVVGNDAPSDRVILRAAGRAR